MKMIGRPVEEINSNDIHYVPYIKIAKEVKKEEEMNEK